MSKATPADEGFWAARADNVRGDEYHEDDILNEWHARKVAEEERLYGKPRPRCSVLDEGTVVAILKEELRDFRDARDWSKFHTPEALARAIGIEAGELNELFLWGTEPTADDIALELADVMIYCLNMANACDIDVTAAIRVKMAMNSKKYPADKTLVP